MFSKSICCFLTKLLLTSIALTLSSALSAQRVEQSEITTEVSGTQPAPRLKVEPTPSNTDGKKQNDKGTTDEDVVEMSVFTVTSGEDEGYQGMNTTSGSRLKTRLKDTPAAISPFTEEFLSDLGATAIEDMLEYAGNVEMAFEDDKNGMNNAESRGPGGQTNFRVRGITAGISANAFDSDIPQSINDTERAEMSSGPNSILFGMGAQGGMLNISSKRANLNKNTLRIKNVMKAWNNRDNLDEVFDNQIFTMDYNVRLMPRKLAFRLLGTYANSGNWRYREFSDEKRLTPILTYKPHKNTTILLRYETGKTEDSPTRVWNATDRITAWIEAGRPLYANFGAEVGADPQVGKLIGDRRVYVDNSGFVFNSRQSLQTIYNLSGGTQTPLPESLSSYNYSTIGPGAFRPRKFESWTATIEQRLGRFSFDLSYHHNESDVYAYAPNADDAALRADPNIYLSPPQWAGTDISSLLLNPNAGRLYMQSSWGKDYLSTSNDVARLMGSTTLKLKKIGRHNIVGLVEYSENERLRTPKAQIWVDDNNIPLSAGNGAPVSEVDAGNDANLVLRRHYVTEGDFSTYYDGDGTFVAPGFTIGDRTFHSTFATINQNGSHIKRDNWAYMIALQSYWFQNKLITTFGYRIDDIEFTREKKSKVGITDPRFLNKSKALNEFDFNGIFDKKSYNPITYNAGAVWHITNRFSVFGNYSSNTGVPYLDSRNVLPYGSTPPPSEGKTNDFGVMVDVLGNDKIFFKLTRYDTRQLGNAVVTPGGTGLANDDTLGGSNLETIFKAMKDAQLISQADFDAHPKYNCGMLDTFSKGYEAELTVNRKNWNIRFTYSYTERERKNIFNEIFDYYNENVPIWMELAKDNPTVIETIRRQLYVGGGSIRGGLDSQLTAQSGGLNSVPHKANVFGRYNFSKGFFKGFSIGGGARYNSRRLLPDPRRTGLGSGYTTPIDDSPHNLGMDLSAYEEANMIKPASSVWFADAFISHKRKVFRGKVNMLIQINIKNVFDRYQVTAGRYLVDGRENEQTGPLPLVLRRTYLNAPRTFQLTTQFEF